MDIIARDQFSKTFSKAGAEAEAMGKKLSGTNARIAKVAGGVALAAGVAAVASVKMAADFQQSMTRLVTAAGESTGNINAVSKGILNLAVQTGTSTQQLARGMYVIESAGFHGAAGLQVLKAAAQGAKTENADLGEVTNALSSLLVDYHLKAGSAADVTSKLVEAVAHGKTTFQEMAAALPNVAAAAQSAGVTLSEVAAAIATMTMHGTQAAKAGTYLRQVIGQLEAPSAKARKVMESLGIDANHLALTLSSGSGHGLADAIMMLEDGIKRHMTPAGLVALDVFKKSKDATTAYQKVLADLPPTLRSSFGALSDMTGGVKSLQGFLQLGGENLKTFKDNTLAVSKATADARGNVEHWDKVQKNLNFKLAQLREVVATAAIQIGTVLVPAVTSLVTWLVNVTAPLLKNQTAMKVLAGVIGGALVAAIIAVTVAWVALNLAFIATPIGALITGMVLIGAAAVVAYNKFVVFRRVVNDLGDAFMVWLRVNLRVVAGVIAGLRLLARGFLAYLLNPVMTVFSAILHGAAIAFGWLGPIGSKLRSARDAFDKFRADVNRIIGGITSHKTFVLDAHVTQATRNAFAMYLNTPSSRVFTTYFQTVKLPGGRMAGFASGTDFAPGGPALVGERGPEIVNLPRGSQVIPNNKVGNGGGNVTINEVHVHGAQTTSQLWQELQKYAKRNGSIRLAGVTG